MHNFKFSLITPEHSKKNKEYLLELYHSILDQTYQNWEWVLFLNNGMSPDHLPDEIKANDKVMIYHCLDDMPNIGEIKNSAFHLGTGDILVEVDHDDILTPDCLEELNKAYQDPSIGFVYSDDAILHMKDEFAPYNEEFGWTHRMFNWKGKDLYSMNSFKASSHSVAFIWFAPDHVRSWRADVYRKIGGHDKSLFICDDHELMVRTYLETKMHHIDKVLYIYRITGNNTWLDRNQAIQEKTQEIFAHYGMRLAEREADLNGLLKVDIGGGLYPQPGYVTVDLRKTAHITHDLNEGLPFNDNSVGVLRASHILEHLKDPIKTMREIHRVLAHGGWAFIDVPSTDGRGAFQDPTHVSYWNENSFMYYTQKFYADFIDNTDIRFQEYRKLTYFPNDFMRNINVCVTTAWLVANKPGGRRLPGGLFI